MTWPVSEDPILIVDIDEVSALEIPIADCDYLELSCFEMLIIMRMCLSRNRNKVGHKRS